MSRRLFGVGVATALTIAVGAEGCLRPTQITVRITSDVCAQLTETGVVLGAPSADSGTVFSATQPGCSGDGEVGSIVLLPSDLDRGATLEVIGAIGKGVSGCTRGDPKCIVARRRLSYIAHTPLTLPIALDAKCEGVTCNDQSTTCVEGRCVSASIDSTRCMGGDCVPDASGVCCTGLVSEYRFDGATLGSDSEGHNDFTQVFGTPVASPETPPGHSGNSINLNGSSALCIASGFTFDSTADHTLCWWARPNNLNIKGEQFDQYCSYDAWSDTTLGTGYVWTTHNCDNTTREELVVPNVYAAGQWVHICQTYSRATLTRTVVINGDTGTKTTRTDSFPITEPPTSAWCIGAYAFGGGALNYFDGLVYRPTWFSRALSDAELQTVYAGTCCGP